jgi:hypothetical protein
MIANPPKSKSQYAYSTRSYLVNGSNRATRRFNTHASNLNEDTGQEDLA